MYLNMSIHKYRARNTLALGAWHYGHYILNHATPCECVCVYYEQTRSAVLGSASIDIAKMAATSI